MSVFLPLRVFILLLLHLLFFESAHNDLLRSLNADLDQILSWASLLLLFLSKAFLELLFFLGLELLLRELLLAAGLTLSLPFS